MITCDCTRDCFAFYHEESEYLVEFGFFSDHGNNSAIDETQTEIALVKVTMDFFKFNFAALMFSLCERTMNSHWLIPGWNFQGFVRRSCVLELYTSGSSQKMNIHRITFAIKWVLCPVSLRFFRVCLYLLQNPKDMLELFIIVPGRPSSPLENSQETNFPWEEMWLNISIDFSPQKTYISSKTAQDLDAILCYSFIKYKDGYSVSGSLAVNVQPA